MNSFRKSFAAASLMALLAIGVDAAAQTTTTVKYDPAEEKAAAIKLANMILDKFPYAEGRLGRDWCFNLEASREERRWYAKFDMEPAPERILRSVRLNAMYREGTGNATRWNYGSIFIGLQFTGEEGKQQAKSKLPQDDPKLPQPGLRQSGAGQGDDAVRVGECPTSFSDFLLSFLAPFQLDPSSSFEWKPDTAMYDRLWRVGERDHLIVHAHRVKIVLQAGDSGGKPESVSLIFAFGGAGGP